MPDIRMPDGTVIRNVPAGTTKAQLEARVAKAKQLEQFKSYGAADLLTSKMTLGLSDKAVPLADAALGMLFGQKFGDTYKKSQADRDRRKAEYQAGNPVLDWASVPLNFMGAAPKAAASAPMTLRKIAGIGGEAGLLTGAGNSRGNLGDQIAQTEMSGVAGALVAPIISRATSAVVSRMAKPIAGRSAPPPPPMSKVRRSALDLASKALADQGQTPADAGALVQQAQQRGVPLALMDTGDETRGLVSALARKPGPNRTLVRDVVIPRQEGQLERVQGALTRDLGPTANIRAQSEALMQQAQAAASPLYEKAYSAPGAGAVHTQIEDLLARPSMKSALSRAARIAAEEGRDPTALGFDVSAQGDTVLKKVPSWQSLDYVKRGLDDVIEGYRDSTTGRLNLDTEGRAINSTLREFLGRVDKVNPDYAAARAAYGGPASHAAAMNKGNKIANKSAEDILAEIRDLTPEQLAQYKLGARSALSSMMEGRVDAADKIKALVGTPKKRDALNQLFGSEGGFDNFLSTLGDEKLAAETFGRVATGSQTSANDADLLNLDNSLGGAALKTAGRAATGQGILSNGLLTVRDLARYGLGKQGERVRTELAALLTETRPSVLAEILKGATEDEARNRLINLSAARAANSAGRVGAMFGGQIPGRGIPAIATPPSN